jgi:flagellin
LGEQLEAAQTQLAAAFTTDVTFVAGGDTLRVKSGGTGADYTITALNSKNEAVKLENFLSTGNQHANKLEIGSFTSTEKQAVAAGAATIGGNNLVTAGNYTVNGTEASTTETFIQVSGDDSYEFTLTGAGGGQLIRADVAGGSLSAIANAINAHSGTEKITASVDGNTLKLTREDGGSIAMTGFSSDGSGTFNVTHAAGQGSAEVLNDDAAAVGATTAAAGLASASTMSLEMSGTDTVTFNISDGDTIAKVRAVSFDTTNNAAALAEIQSALSAAGSSITASIGGAGAATDPIVLTNSSGGQIKLTEFTSDSTETMTATPGAGQGVGKILDDTGLSGSGSALSSVNLASQEGADDALAIIDAAMENINSTRSELGAMSNRLDHTINNLGNVVVNTEASQSRIEDADFATETSNLTKAQILSQAATAMLAQANASKQSVLSLLQG